MAQMKWSCWLVALMSCAGSAGAAGELLVPEGFKLAGEILVSPPRSSGKSSSAASSENRERARSYKQDGTSAAGATVVIVPEDEEGLLSPRGTDSLPETRAKAREYQSDTHGQQPQILIVPGQEPGRVETTRERLEENRSKARSYMKGETPVGMVGADGLLVVNCRDVDSVAGRIGDDTQSGSVISIFQNGKQVKVRCK